MWSRSKVKGKWRPTFWTTRHPTVSSRSGDSGAGSRCRDLPPRARHLRARTHHTSERLKTRDVITWIPSKEIKPTSRTESVLGERSVLSFVGRLRPRPCRRWSVSLVSSLSLRLLEQCKVCLFKTTPLSLCQKKINAVHKATFYLTLLGFLFPPQIIFVCLYHMTYTEVLIFNFLN